MLRVGVISLLVGGLALGTASPAQSNSDVEVLPQHRYALLIGVGNYEDQSIGTLTDPVNDVARLKDALSETAQFDDITVLTDDNQGHLPTRTNILKALYKIRNLVPANGDALLLVMFSGHGGMMPNGDGFLLPRDAAASSEPGLLSDTSIPVSLLLKSMADTKANQTIVVMDACRNYVTSTAAHGSDQEQSLTNAFEKQFYFRSYNKDLRASLILFATGVGEKALVDGQTKLGYFSEVLVDGIRGANADSSGNVTLAKLVSYIQSEVPRRVGEAELKAVQKPEYILTGYQPEKLVFSKVGARPDPVSPPVSPSAQAGPAGLTPQKLGAAVHWYTQKHFNPDVDNRSNMSAHSLWLDLPDDVLSQVRSATYILQDKSFHPMYAVPDNSKHLAIRFKAYGCVDSATVVVQLANGSSVSSDFNECKKHQEDKPVNE